MKDFNKLMFILNNYLKHITLTFTFILVIFVNSSLALNWTDKEWLEGGCPTNIMGTWVSESTEFSHSKVVMFQSDKVIIKNNNGKLDQYFFKGNLRTFKNKIVEVSLITNPSPLGLYLKIRPHLISTIGVTREKLKSPICFIKVFKFLNEEGAMFGKYSSWDIYQYKN